MPLDAGRVHRLAGVIKLFAEIGVHAGDHIGLQRLAHALGGRRIFPGEVAAAILLDRLALVDLPEIIIDLLGRVALARFRLRFLHRVARG